MRYNMWSLVQCLQNIKQGGLGQKSWYAGRNREAGYTTMLNSFSLCFLDVVLLTFTSLVFARYHSLI